MRSVLASSEFQEASALMARLMQSNHFRPPSDNGGIRFQRASLEGAASPAPVRPAWDAPRPLREPVVTPPPAAPVPSIPIKRKASEFQILPLEGPKGDRLEALLAELCRRAGFNAAMLADNSGLALATHNIALERDALAAYSSILMSVLEKAESILNQLEANNISIDVNALDRLYLRRFFADTTPCSLLVVCSQSVDAEAAMLAGARQLSELLTL